MIVAKDIHKSFGKKEVLKGVTFEMGRGETVALMGANGAGKSTLFDILSTLDPRFQGSATVGGYDVRTQPLEVKGAVGYVPGLFSLYEDLSVKENLVFFAKAFGCNPDDIHKLSPYLWRSLEPFSEIRAGHLSGGMKQKLAICCAMVHNPSVLLLDEPTVGVDPVSRADMWKEIAALRKTGVSVLVSTHYLDEAARADKILFLHQGVMMLYDTPQGILHSYRHNLYSLPCESTRLSEVEAELKNRRGVIDIYLYGDKVHIIADEDFDPAPVIGRPLTRIEPEMEDIFIETLSSRL